MDQTLNQFLAIMDDERAGYVEMLSILADERDAASLTKKDRLLAVGRRKQALVQSIQEMEQRRQALVEKLALERGIEECPLTVSRLAHYLSPNQAIRIKASAAELKTLVKKVRRENDANSQLFSFYLELIHGSLRMFNDLVYSHGIYEKPGSENRGAGYGGARGRVFYQSI